MACVHGPFQARFRSGVARAGRRRLERATPRAPPSARSTPNRAVRTRNGFTPTRRNFDHRDGKTNRRDRVAPPVVLGGCRGLRRGGRYVPRRSRFGLQLWARQDSLRRRARRLDRLLLRVAAARGEERQRCCPERHHGAHARRAPAGVGRHGGPEVRAGKGFFSHALSLTSSAHSRSRSHCVAGARGHHLPRFASSLQRFLHSARSARSFPSEAARGENPRPRRSRDR